LEKWLKRLNFAKKRTIMQKIPTTFTELVRFDWFMKYMFRDKSDFEVLEGFLSVLLKEDIIILEILESEGNQSRKKAKWNRVDVLVKTSTDERIIVEIQNNEEFDYLQRILFGACKTITDNINKGEPYASIKKVISVSIVYFRAAQGRDYIYHGYTLFRGMHLNDELLLNEEQQAAFNKSSPSQIYPEYYLVQALEFSGEINDTLDEWVYLFKNSKVEDDFTAKGIDKAKEKLAIAKLPKRKRLEYERYLKSLHDEASWNETQRIKAMMQEKRDREVQEAVQRAEEAEKIAEQAQQEREKAKQEQEKAQQEREKAEQEREKAEQEREKAEQEREKAEFLLGETQKKAIIKALQRGKLSLEEIADDNEVSVEFVLRIQKDAF
jgi:predicted transposase/invertase (TIGR01784 family)